MDLDITMRDLSTDEMLKLKGTKTFFCKKHKKKHYEGTEDYEKCRK